MSRRVAGSLLGWWMVAPFVHAATLTGTVIGEGARPIAGAVVQVVRSGGETACATNTAADGTFVLPCSATGRHAVRASFGDLRPWTIDDVELGPDLEPHLNFMLLPATAVTADDVPVGEPDGFWTRRIPNPVLGSWGDRPVTLRMLAIVVAALSFPLGAATMLALGRRFGIETRRLAPDEVADLVVNPSLPSVGERLTPIATVGARGASASVTYGADEIAVALAEKRYALVFASLVIAPGLFALFSLALALAMLIGQEAWLLYGMLLVPAGFVLTPIMIALQAVRRRSG
jgi:hypothetical protein